MSSDNNQTGTPKAMRNLFGIIMIVVYIGMGVLFFVGFFKPLYESWTWVRWVFGGLFTAYGIWRAYRQFAGIDDPYA
ncbi:MAG: hypothetical protein J1E38_02180 [Paramuribaculum sp.]|nr:hypothetical protein [Paramuribaculum sp.]